MPIGNSFSTLGRLSGDVGVTTMVTTGIGGVRATTVPFDKSLTKKEKADTITWILASDAACLGAQVYIYKALDKVLSDVSIHGQKLDKYKDQLKTIDKHIPELKINEAMEKISKSGTKLSEEAVLGNVERVIKHHCKDLAEDAEGKYTKKIKLGKEKLSHSELSTRIYKNFKDIIKGQVSEQGKPICEESVKKAVTVVKKYKGGFQKLKFIFGVALGTSYLVPWLVFKNLKKISAVFNKEEKAKIKAKEAKMTPEQKAEAKAKSMKHTLLEFGAPLALTLGALAALKNPKVLGEKFEKGIEKYFAKKVKLKTVDETGKKVTKEVERSLKEFEMSESDKISRNIVTNATLRSTPAFMTGNPFVGVYQIVMEGISLVLVKGLDKAIGKAEQGGKGIAPWIARKVEKGVNPWPVRQFEKHFPEAAKKINVDKYFKIKPQKLNERQKQGVDFATTHFISTYLTLGLILGVVTNKISKPLSDFLKKYMPNPEETDRATEMEARQKAQAPLANKKLDQMPHLKTQNDNPMLQKFVAKQMTKA